MTTTEALFVEAIESGVRRWVLALRRAGINTTCSCHHEGYIQCSSYSPTWEIDTIRRALLEECGEDLSVLGRYEIHVWHEQMSADLGAWHQFLEIRSPTFKTAAEGEEVLP